MSHLQPRRRQTAVRHSTTNAHQCHQPKLDLVPIGMALWVSFTSWNGQGSPFTSSVEMAGGRNYARLFTEDGLARLDFMTSVRNTAYYVAIVVPVQTVLSLFLALVVNQRFLRGRSTTRRARWSRRSRCRHKWGKP